MRTPLNIPPSLLHHAKTQGTMIYQDEEPSLDFGAKVTLSKSPAEKTEQ